MTTSRLFNLASAARDLLVQDWPTDDTIASPLPDREYVNNGAVIWDCEQLVVSVERTFGIIGDVTQEIFDAQYGTMALRAMTIAVWIIRCVPDIDSSGQEIILPTPAALEESAAELLADEDQVIAILAKAQREGRFAGCESLAFENWQAQGPEGGFGGGVTRLRIGLV